MSRLGVFGNLQSKIAHTSTIPALGNKDLRLLQEWITAEKGVVNTLLRLVGDLDKAHEALTHWGAGEGADLGDILSRSRDLLSHASIAFGRYAEHEGAMRQMMKGIRTREEALDEAKKRRRTLIGRAEAAQKKLSKMTQENKQLPQQTELLSSLRQEIAQLDGFIYNEEAAIMDFKRRTTKDIMGLKFGGLSELAEKITIVGTLGKDLIEDIPLDATVPGQMRMPYGAFDKTRSTVEEAVRCVNSISFNPVPAETLPPRRPGEWDQSHSSQAEVPEEKEEYRQTPGLPEPHTEEELASPDRPELPHHLSSNIGLSSPVDLSSPTKDWLSPAATMNQATSQSAPPSDPAYSEFGQLTSPTGGRAAATFPIAAAHSRDAAYLSTLGMPGTVGQRPSSLAYLQDSPPGSATLPPDSPSMNTPQSATQTAYPRMESQPPSVTANPWTEPAPPSARSERSMSDALASPQLGARRRGNKDDYHYEYSDSAFWVRNNMPETRSVGRKDSSNGLDAANDAESTSPLDPPQAPAMYGAARNRSNSNLAAERGSNAGQDDASRFGAPTRPRIDISPAPSSNSIGESSPGGPRTIAAAAFRRTPRASSESVTEPLHVKKRVSVPEHPESEQISSPHEDQSVPTIDSELSHEGGSDEAPPPFSLIAPPGHSPSPKPLESPSEGGVHGRRLPVPPSAGYNQGQFATKLDS